ncbi:uncharacterized protein [Argopecten irradians]|uniref:uncharacterized protein n=1 Tax=Argopecten irradians TaxID=31199 RepID=UPI0037182F50
MFFQCLLSIWILLLVPSSTTDHRINTTAILTEYALVCGLDYMCNANSLPSLPRPTGYDHIIKCPSCSCNPDDCFEHHTCCPDLVFRYPEMSCVDVSLSNDSRGPSVLMAASCPLGTEDDTACTTHEYDNADKIKRVPVSLTAEVFRNTDCASCHGVKHNLTRWNFKMDCDRIVDINHISSYEGIFQAGLDNKCNMSYQYSGIPQHFQCSENDYPGFKHCNMTGQWGVYDANVDWACRNVQQPYRGFDNVYCFVCNPVKHPDSQLISVCNSTAMWDPYDSELEEACLYYPVSQIAYPFKNRFCYSCNRDNRMLGSFMDAETSVDMERWDTAFKNTYEAVIGIQYFRRVMLQADLLQVISNTNVVLAEYNLNTYSNMSNILFLYYLHYGVHGNCPLNGENRNDQSQKCTCSLSCVSSSSCCAEFAMSDPVAYTNTFRNSLAVSKCYRLDKSRNTTLQEKCESTMQAKGILQIPVRSRSSDILYRNVYCFLCNEGHGSENQEDGQGVDTSDIEQGYDPLDLQIQCNFIFQTERYLLLDDMLKDFDQMADGDEKCTFSILYDLYDNKKLVPDTIDRCNVTGDWDIYDTDIEQACLAFNHDITHTEYSGAYKNIYCEMCNTALGIGLTYTSCDVNMTYNDECEMYPQVTSMTPYKNYFCKLCNYRPPPIVNMNPIVGFDSGGNTGQNDSNCNNRRTDGNSGINGMIDFGLTVRDLFSITVAPEFSGDLDKEVSTYGNHCLGNEIYDTEKQSCIMQECAGGKMLIEKRCKPLLQLTSALGYTVALRVTVSALALEDMTVETLLVTIEKDRYEIDNSTRNVKLLPGGPLLSFGNYELLKNTSLIICVEDFIEMIESRSPVPEGVYDLTFIVQLVSFLCTCLSILCLIITFLTYCFFAELRTLPGKNNMCLIVSLFFSQCLVQFGMNQAQYTTLCVIIAILVHFFWLSTFFSMNVCSFHMFRVFVFPLAEVKRVHSWTCFWYLCYVYGMSALIVIVSITLSTTVFNAEHLGYTGKGYCFLTRFESVITTFISPILLVCLSNIIFFVFVTYKISTAPKIPSTRHARQEFPLYVKLFVLTGATWILQIIDAFIPLSVFSVISGIMNSSQGIFIFLSYSTNARVRKFYKARISSSRVSTASRAKRAGFVQMPDNAGGADEANQDSRI